MVELSQLESEFINDLENAFNDWDYEIEYYHENDNLQVEVDFDLDQWGEDADDIYDSISELEEDWTFEWDYDFNHYEFNFSEED